MRKLLLVFAALVIVALAFVFAGSIWHERPAGNSQNSQNGNESQTPTGDEDSINDTESHSQILTLLDAWWTPDWSEDGCDANVNYSLNEDMLRTTIYVGTSYDPYGVQMGTSEVKCYTGVDVYGREQNLTVGTLSLWHGGTVKPDSTVAYGTFIRPPGKEFGEGVFSLDIKITVNCEFTANGQLVGGSGNEEFFGHLLTSSGKITFSGNVTSTFDIDYGEVVWTSRTERTKYYYNDNLYAETLTLTIPKSSYISGEICTLSWTVKTTTSFTDGSTRESEIVILWHRDENGMLTGKSASGTVTGTEIVNGKQVSYSGSITLDYEYNSQVGFHKTAYHEKRTSSVALPKRLPFEVIFVDDPYMRPLF